MMRAPRARLSAGGSESDGAPARGSRAVADTEAAILFALIMSLLRLGLGSCLLPAECSRAQTAQPPEIS
eukprot:2547782-Rhodomonas_salina.1